MRNQLTHRVLEVELDWVLGPQPLGDLAPLQRNYYQLRKQGHQQRQAKTGGQGYPRGDVVHVEQLGTVQHHADHIDEERHAVEDRQRSESRLERLLGTKDEAANGQEEQDAHNAAHHGRDEPRSHDGAKGGPLQALDAAGHQGKSNGGAHDAVCSRYRQLQESGHQQPHGTTGQSSHAAQHQNFLGALVQTNFQDALAHGVRDLIACKIRNH